MKKINRCREGELNFPPFPRNSQEIYDYPGNGERMACAIIHNCTVRQLMAFRKLRLKLGEQGFRDVLVQGLNIVSRSKTIDSPAGWLYSFIKMESENA